MRVIARVLIIIVTTILVATVAMIIAIVKSFRCRAGQRDHGLHALLNNSIFEEAELRLAIFFQ